jgi:hypothetical protein
MAASTVVLDYRRLDQRRQTLENPYWFTSKDVSMVDAEDKAAVLISFPKAGLNTLVLAVFVQVVTIGAGGTPACTIGYGTLATDSVTTGGACTATDEDNFCASAAVTWTTAGYYPAGACDWFTDVSTPVFTAAAARIVGAASTVPFIGAWYTDVGTPTQGVFRVHLLLTDLPGIAV